MNIIKKYWGVLHRVRALHVSYNILHLKRLSKNKKLYEEYGVSSSVVGSISHKKISKPSKEKPWLDRDNGMETMQKDSRFNGFSTEMRNQLLNWHEKGYIILKGFVPSDLCDKINADFDAKVQSGEVSYDYTASRVMNLYRNSDAVRKVINNPELIALLSFILNKRVVPFQTIDFKYGSQQNTHSDSIHMTTEPLGYLLAIWVALEDLTPGCGLLHYYPGSNKLPYVMGEDFENDNGVFTVGDNFYENYEKKISEVIREKGLKKEIFAAKKGDLLIWHANLLHGGEKRSDEATRKSLVCHYYTNEGDVINYHEITQRPTVFHKPVPIED